MKLIVGLGNPGPAYESTRHNIGFMVVDKLIDTCAAIKASKSSFKGELYKAKDLLLLKPTTFMNLSGQSVQAVAHFYKIKSEDILVIHDDLDLPFGAVRIKVGGGHGGHNGLKSIDSAIGKEYVRLRLGIGKPEFKDMVSSYVLSPFSKEEQVLLEKFIDYAKEVALAWSKGLAIEQLKSRYSKKDSGYLL